MLNTLSLRIFYFSLKIFYFASEMIDMKSRL